MNAAIALMLAAALSAQAAPRSEAARLVFVKQHACPSTHLHKLPCKGYVIDHIKALDCGGKDDPSNMQWQTIAAGKAKDKWERSGPDCKHPTKGN